MLLLGAYVGVRNHEAYVLVLGVCCFLLKRILPVELSGIQCCEPAQIGSCGAFCCTYVLQLFVMGRIQMKRKSKHLLLAMDYRNSCRVWWVLYDQVYWKHSEASVFLSISQIRICDVRMIIIIKWIP